jgi:L-asparaginase/Glu-tRNA(Gln) amidotransferase subunit D
MPGDVARAILAARKAGLVVVVVSRVSDGRIDVRPQFIEAGVIAGEGLDGLKARTLLTVALGATKDIPTIQRWFQQAAGVAPF